MVGPPHARWLARCESDVPAGAGWLAPDEAARAATMRFTKRRTEYLTRRWTGKLAVARMLGLPTDPASLRRVAVRNAASGAPEAYVDGRAAGVRISLTDRAGWAVCLVSSGPDAIGCDLELVEPRSPAFLRDLLTPAERRAACAAGGDRYLLANLIWSAKESALKVLGTGLRRDTRSVEITVDSGSRLTARTAEGSAFPGWWCRHGAFLLTVVSAAAGPAPVPLEDPPTLATAVPLHTWLDRPVAV
jgi:4'-phosphopantetheinyl transferase